MLSPFLRLFVRRYFEMVSGPGTCTHSCLQTWNSQQHAAQVRENFFDTIVCGRQYVAYKHTVLHHCLSEHQAPALT